MVLMCLALSVFSTMPEFEEQATLILYYIVNCFNLKFPSGQFQEIIFVFWLAIEYACRIWSAGCRSRYRGWRMFYDGPGIPCFLPAFQALLAESGLPRPHTASSVACLSHFPPRNASFLDIIVITASLVVLCMGATGQVLGFVNTLNKTCISSSFWNLTFFASLTNK